MTPIAVDLNCDLGELPGAEGRSHDRRLMRWISSANVACGGHAGDATSMRATVQAARDMQVAVGAHPGFEDRASMGRKEQPASDDKVRQLVLQQLQSLHEIAQSEGISLAHVKPHGALYHLAASDLRIAGAVCDAVVDLKLSLRLFGLADSALLTAARARGLTVACEFFADRHYLASGQLVPRDHPQACLNDPEEIARRVLHVLRAGTVSAIDATEVPVVAQTICLHSDHPRAEENCAAVARHLSTEGIHVRAEFSEL